ncbi:claudin-4 [Amia ocellicauda]|uniref:claudin-4 n=1 Tax=Amia ocellicauda TaxID=2972642 RepID=UPI003464E113
MAASGLQMLGIALCIIGWIGAILTCALPMWKVTAFVGENIVTAQITWEGIWMSCVVQSTGQMQCKVYDSMLALSSDLQAARALIVIGIVIGILGILLGIAGGKCTNCVEDESSKAKVGITAGVVFIISGVLCLIPVCWTANTIIRNFYNPLLLSSQKREIGAALVMASTGLQILGMMLSLFGWTAAIMTCALPMWRVTAFIGTNIVVAQVIWEGLWMSCVVQSTGQMQCKIYDSLLSLPQDLQAARALTVMSVLAGLAGIMLSIIGGKCTNCVEDEAAKAKLGIVAGVFIIIAGVLCLVPVSWSANTIVMDFYNPLVTEAQRREFGPAMYIGWGASILLVLGGALLCCNCPPKENRSHSANYSHSRALSKDYV